jgi:hypothetical protein
VPPKIAGTSASVRAGKPSVRPCLDGLRERGADVAAQRVVAGERFVGALEDDDVLLALERGDDGGLREGANDVDVDGADADAAGLAQVVDGGFDVFSGRAERDEDGVGVVGLVLGDEAVVAAGELAEILVGGFKEFRIGSAKLLRRATMPCM